MNKMNNFNNLIKLKRGNLLFADTEAIVNAVNTVGVMGKGIALQFKNTYSEMFRIYREACIAREVVPGKMFIYECRDISGPHFIINFPTKRHWRDPSRMKDIRDGLRALVRDIQRLGIKSIALPALGCGNGGLNWNKVYRKV